MILSRAVFPEGSTGSPASLAKILVVIAVSGLVSCKGGKYDQELSNVEPAPADDTVQLPDSVSQLDSANSNPLKSAYFGDLHLHTLYSSDANIMGAFTTPDMAYDFAKGGEITHPSGVNYKLQVPLDFLAVTDHSEWFGEVGIALSPEHALYSAPFIAELREAWKDRDLFNKVFGIIFDTEKKGRRPEFSVENEAAILNSGKSLWADIVAAAERHNDPGRFTTFSAFEWSATPKGQNLHRNVIFRGSDVPDHVPSFFELRTPEELWTWLEQVGGGESNVLAIPHNSNLSNGLMFSPYLSDGSKYDAETAKRRQMLEPLVEIAQIKGYSESNPEFAPTDEFIDFQLVSDKFGWLDVEKINSPYSWVREGLKEGLLQQEKIGVNPFEFGFVGATDAHFGLAGDTSEGNWKGIFSKSEIRHGYPAGLAKTMNPGAITGVWAESNTREHIWSAMQKRETFATSGTRIKVRLFGSWRYKSDLMESKNWLVEAYDKGVPMGSILPAREKAVVAPLFAVWGQRGVDGAPLERIQIIKGWVEQGEKREIIYDVVCADGSKPDSNTRRCQMGDAPVDLSDCSYSEDYGARELKAIWSDPDFDPKQNAFYYARVLEIPTCRWTTFEALRDGTDVPEGLPLTIRERAWSSPLWYAKEE